MKILYYSSHPNLNLASPSGYGTHMREMIAAFKVFGHEVKPVIMGGRSLDTANLEIKARGRHKQLLASLVPNYLWESAKDFRLLQFDKYAAKVLRQEIEAFVPDLIYERAAYLQTSGIETAKEFGIKHVLEVNAPYAEERKNLQGNSYFADNAERAERTLLDKTDKVVVVSNVLKEHLCAKYKVSSTKFILTPNAINPAHLILSTARVKHLQAALNLNHKIVIGFVGSIFPWHGVDLLISAFKLLISTEEGKDGHLLIVGDGQILNDLKVQAKEAELDDKITFTGNVPHRDVFNYLELMNICVMGKSNWYGSPVKIFEYGAMGKAIIAPDNGPLRDVCSHMSDAVLVDPTTESIFKALDLLTKDIALRDKIAVNFKEKVLAQHTWLSNVERVMDSIK